MSCIRFLTVVLVVAGTSPAACGSSGKSEQLLGRGAAVDASTVWVSPRGTDDGDGTRENPLGTIQAAVDGARDGARIVLRPGRYARFSYSRLRGQAVEVVSETPGGASVDGVDVRGGKGLHLTGLSFTGSVYVGGSSDARPRGSGDVWLRGVRITTRRTAPCLVIRGGSRDIRVEDSSLSQCSTGVSGPPDVNPSEHIRIARTSIQGVSEDGMQFGSWHHVDITEVDVQEIRDPKGKVHNDAIQVVGGVFDARITRSRLSGSTAQLLFISNDRGANREITVENNLLYGAGGFAAQISGVVGLRVVNNTIWANRYGGLLLRPTSAGVQPSRVVLANNIIEGYGGPRTVVSRGNLIVSGRDASNKAGVAFVDPGRGDFRLEGSSSAKNRGAREYAPALDFFGRRRGGAPSVGAIQ